MKLQSRWQVATAYFFFLKYFYHFKDTPVIMKEFWNNRYSAEEYIYGKEPNAYFRQIIQRMKPGRLLVPGAGEGRDAVFAAQLGWQVYAFDQSRVGKEKALALASEKGVAIVYHIADVSEVEFPSQSFDLIAIIYFHLPRSARQEFYNKTLTWLQSGGYLVIEAFNPGQKNRTSGGPKDPDLLQTSSELDMRFSSQKIIENKEIKVELDEGSYHRGEAEVVRFFARKP